MYLCIQDPPAGGQKPTADDPYREITTDVGDDVELSCVTDGSPLPSYRWYKGGEQVDMTDPRIRQFGGNLFLSGAVTSDSGEFRCNATNGMGSASVTRQLVVNRKF